MGYDLSMCRELVGNDFLKIDELSTCRELIGKECPNFLSGGNGKKTFRRVGNLWGMTRRRVGNE